MEKARADITLVVDNIFEINRKVEEVERALKRLYEALDDLNDTEVVLAVSAGEEA